MDPKRPSPAEPVLSIDAVHTEDHVVWDEPDRFSLDRLEVGFVLMSWVVAMLATAAIFTVSSLIVAAVSSDPLFGETSTDLGVLTILAAMSTFIGFVTTMVVRLVRVDHDRVVNSLAVAVLHTVIAISLFLGTLAARAVTGDGIVDDAFDGSTLDRVGNLFSVLERSAAAAVVACLLAIGMVPARGERPQGTQTDHTPQDRQL
jgi:hypothetical protein